MVTDNVSSDTIYIYVITDKILKKVSLKAKAKLIDKIYWVVTKETIIKDAVAKLLSNPLKSVFVVDGDGKVVGALTTNEEIIETSLKKKPKGPKSRCRQECETACMDRGGCGLVIADQWGACMWECKDKMGTLGPDFDQKLEVLLP